MPQVVLQDVLRARGRHMDRQARGEAFGGVTQLGQRPLDTAARAILGACFHNSVRPDPAADEAARRRYAQELGDMATAYLLTPGRSEAPRT